MSLHPHPFTAVPPETARVARAVFPKSNLYMRLRDELGAIYEDEAFARPHMRHSTPRGDGSKPQHLKRTTGSGRELKARSRRASVGTACGGPAIKGKQKPIYNISSLPPP